MVQLEKDLKASEATLARTQESHANQAAMISNLQQQIQRQTIELQQKNRNPSPSPRASASTEKKKEHEQAIKLAQDYDELAKQFAQCSDELNERNYELSLLEATSKQLEQEKIEFAEEVYFLQE